MNVHNGSFAVKLTYLLFAVLLPAISIASECDFHADGAFHDSCPLCRFHVDGNSLTVTASLACVHFYFTHFLPILEPDSPLRPVWHFIANLPNAPPVA